jgi:hypothetical protein
MYVQVMPETDAEKYRLHPFDLTKVWPQADYPLIEVGEFELNKNPENFFADVEQSAFAPSNLVPGIGVSPDKMLQARLFNYADAQRYRLGVNHHQIPVNAARCPVHSNHRDGRAAWTATTAACRTTSPTASASGRRNPRSRSRRSRSTATAASGPSGRTTPTTSSNPAQAVPPDVAGAAAALFGNTARAMGDAPEFIKFRHIRNCHAADPAYGAGVAKALGLDDGFLEGARRIGPEFIGQRLALLAHQRQHRRLQPGKTEAQVAGMQHRPRQSYTPGLPSSASCDSRPAGVRQPEQLGALVEGLAGRIVQRFAEQFVVAHAGTRINCVWPPETSSATNGNAGGSLDSSGDSRCPSR